MVDANLTYLFGGMVIGAIGTFGALVSYTRLVGAPARATAGRAQLHEWARRDIVGHATTPPAVDTRVRLVTDSQTATRDTLTFHLYDYQAQQERDLTFRTTIVARFMQCDTPRRSEWRGSNGDYSLLIQVGKRYGWLGELDNGYVWTFAYATRDRRVRNLEAWASA